MKSLAVVALILAAGCADNYDRSGGTPDMVVKDREYVPSMDPKRTVTEQDCSKPVDVATGNLRCK